MTAYKGASKRAPHSVSKLDRLSSVVAVISSLMAQFEGDDIGWLPANDQLLSCSRTRERASLGCIPLFEPLPNATQPAANWMGGYFCPCHGSKYDLAGRVFRTKAEKLPARPAR
jgi:hypothetical protein